MTAAAALLAGLLSIQGGAVGATQWVARGDSANRPYATITAYCLAGKKTSSGKRVYPGCLALSRPLARQLGLKRGPGDYDYRFGTRIWVQGLGCFVFDDLMPPQWRHPRVDIHRSTLRECRAFGLRRAQVWLVSRGP